MPEQTGRVQAVTRHAGAVAVGIGIAVAVPTALGWRALAVGWWELLGIGAVVLIVAGVLTKRERLLIVGIAVLCTQLWFAMQSKGG